MGEVRAELGRTMHEHVGVYRDAAGLEAAHAAVLRLKEEAQTAWIDDGGKIFNQDVLAALELGHLLDVAESIVVAAQARTESRGSHFRTDHPARDDARLAPPPGGHGGRRRSGRGLLCARHANALAAAREDLLRPWPSTR